MARRWAAGRASRAWAIGSLLLVVVASSTSAASPEPSPPWATPQEHALAAVRAIDPRFADLPDYIEAYQQSVSELDMAPILAGSWVNVLPTFEAQGPPWTDLGRGLLVEVMLAEGCLDTLAGVEVPGDGDPCGWRHSWIYRVMPSGEVVLIAEGGSPEP